MQHHDFIVRAARASSALICALIVGGCAASGGTVSTTSSGSTGPTAMSTLATASSEPIATEAATIRVAGLACPKCATNVDVQLSKIPGVKVGNIDMKHGFVQVTFVQQPHPSPARLGRAVEDSGLTFLGLVDGAAPMAPLPPANPMISGR